MQSRVSSLSQWLVRTGRALNLAEFHLALKKEATRKPMICLSRATPSRYSSTNQKNFLDQTFIVRKRYCFLGIVMRKLALQTGIKAIASVPSGLHVSPNMVKLLGQKPRGSFCGTLPLYPKRHSNHPIKTVQPQGICGCRKRKDGHNDLQSSSF